ncbi:MAG: TlpA family protein disulfide reductase [Phycisphaerales bacterium]|nr:TlpA family protein disulfide reductase [Phycisphaerales bacterium]
MKPMKMILPLVAFVALSQSVLGQDAKAPVATPPTAVPTAAPALAPAADAESAKVKAIYDRAVQVVKSVKAIDLVSQLDIKGGSMGMPPEFLRPARLRMVFAEGSMMPFSMLRIDSAESIEAIATAASIGAVNADGAIYLDATAKTFQKAPIDRFFEALGPCLMSLPQWFFGVRTGVMGGEVVKYAYRGEAEIDGQKCDVIAIERVVDMGEFAAEVEEGGDAMDEGEVAAPSGEPQMRMREVLTIARSDGFPRRAEISPVLPEGSEDGGFGAMPAALMSAITVDPTFDAAIFAPVIPEGWTEAVVEKGADMGSPELKVKVGDVAPAFTLKNAEGVEVTQASLLGKVVVLDFWATWCGPCKAAMPELQKISDDYKDKGVIVYGVNMSERTPDAGTKYMTKKGFTYGCLLEGEKLADIYGVTGIPTLVVIDAKGKAAFLEVGFQGPEALRKAIDAALTTK